MVCSCSRFMVCSCSRFMVCSCSRFMVDSADRALLDEAKAELHGLLARPQLDNIPVLILGNKKDLPGAMDTKELIEAMYVLHATPSTFSHRGLR